MRICILLFAGVLALGSGAAAQTDGRATEPPELIALRGELARTIARVQIAPLTNQLRALESLKQQFAREGKLDSALAVGTEAKSVQQQLDAAQAAADLTTAAPTQFKLESAFYGDPKTKRLRDVTAAVRSAIDSGTGTLTVDTADLGRPDPAPGTEKFLIVTFTINGQRREKTFKERTVVNFKQQLH
jgi:hypothetical protein